MRLMVLTAAVFPTREDAEKKLWIYLASCRKFGIDPHLYGTGRVFSGYRSVKLDVQLEYLEAKAGDFSHVLYSDSWDAFFCAPLAEIIAKYEAMGAPPILTSAAHKPWPEEQASSGLYDESLVYRYPHVGGYIAETRAIIKAFRGMLKLERQTGDDCVNWFDAWTEGWFRPAIDSGCEIFQVSADNCEAILYRGYAEGSGPMHPRIINTATQQLPCIFHLPGGYTDPITGKDDRMIPWAKQLEIIP